MVCVSDPLTLNSTSGSVGGVQHTQEVAQELTITFHQSQQVRFIPRSDASESKALHIPHV